MKDKEVLEELVNILKSNHTTVYKRISVSKRLKKGFDPNTKLYGGKNIGHYLVKYNVSGLFNKLLKYHYYINICDDKFDTPLHRAVKENNYKLVKEIISAGCDVNIPGEYDCTPLHYACIYGKTKIVKCLLSAGAYIDSVDENNLSPIDYAKDENNLLLVKLLESYVMEN